MRCPAVYQSSYKLMQTFLQTHFFFTLLAFERSQDKKKKEKKKREKRAVKSHAAATVCNMKRIIQTRCHSRLLILEVKKESDEFDSINIIMIKEMRSRRKKIINIKDIKWKALLYYIYIS